MRADHIKRLLDEATIPAMPDDYPRAMRREKAEAIISAAVSLYECPAGGTAAGFALLDLMVGALNLDNWSYRDAAPDMPQERTESA